jgi:hypothetical protein
MQQSMNYESVSRENRVTFVLLSLVLNGPKGKRLQHVDMFFGMLVEGVAQGFRSVAGV